MIPCTVHFSLVTILTSEQLAPCTPNIAGFWVVLFFSFIKLKHLKLFWTNMRFHQFLSLVLIMLLILIILLIRSKVFRTFFCTNNNFDKINTSFLLQPFTLLHHLLASFPLVLHLSDRLRESSANYYLSIERYR